jgi:MFS family permease
MTENTTSADKQNSNTLPANVKATGLVSFFTDLGSEMIYPLLPAFITGDLGASKTMLGLIEGLSEATPAMFKLLAGVWADRIKNRKWLIFLGYFISSAFKPFIGLAANAWQVLGLRFFDRMGKGIRGAPRDALIADSTSETMRGRAFGYNRAMDHLGALGGGMVAWFLIWKFGLSIKQVIVFSILPGFLCLLTIVFFLQEMPGRGVEAKQPLFQGVEELPKDFWLFLIGMIGFAIANSSDAFLLLRSKEMGISASSIPLVWSFLHLIKSSASWYGGKLSDTLGPKTVIAGGWFLYAGVYLGFALATGPLAVWILFGIYGLFFGATEGAAKAWVADLVPIKFRGTAYGILGVAEGLMLFPASLLTGYLWDGWGSFLPLALGSVSAFSAAFWILLALPAKR